VTAGTGDLVLVLGARGGAGASLVAAGLALARVDAGRAGTLVDLDLERGDLGGSWGAPPDRTLSDLLAVADELDPGHVRCAAFPHPCGVTLLAAPGAPGADAPWRGAPGERLVEAIAGLGPVVADGGCALTSLALAAAARARATLLVCPPTLAGARRAARVAGHMTQAGLGAPDLVANEGGGRHELRPGALARATGVECVATLPFAERDAEDIESARWPTGRRSALARAIAELAEGIG
jgi:pilus assembly protein CpaE